MKSDLSPAMLPIEARIANGINVALEVQGAASGCNVRVKVAGGILTLRGYVSTAQEKYLAQLLARHASGMSLISNELEVRGRAQGNVCDAAIQTEALAVLRLQYLSDFEGIRVNVAAGAVSLNGNVHSLFRHDIAETGVMAVNGVTSFHNALVVKFV